MLFRSNMFRECSNLSNITMIATDISASGCLTSWVSGVAATGTFVKASLMTSLTTGESGIPSGWTIMDDTEYLTISALEDGEITITIPSNVNSTYATSLSYSKDKLNWAETTVDNTEQIITISVSNGENVYLKGIANTWGCVGRPWEQYSLNIASSADINASGNIMSLLYGDKFKDKTSFPAESEHSFWQLFEGNNHLINAEHLILPATTLVDECYSRMFSGCTLLINGPALPATTLGIQCYRQMFYECNALTTVSILPANMLTDWCYESMFYNCISLEHAPELPAMTMTTQCYANMFQGCTSLTTAPSLPATTLASYCYSGMFSGCASLVTAPELPATTLADSCYSSMFKGCTSLTTSTELPATTLTENCYYEMFTNCTSLTTAPTLSAAMLAGNCYRSMFSGCTSLTTAPALPATTLEPACYYEMFAGCKSLIMGSVLPATTLLMNCYGNMFQGCSKLNSITMLATNISAKDCLSNWVSGVSSTGTFVKAPSMTSLPTGTSGIPSGWTVLDDTEYLTISALGSGTITITY